VPLLYPRDALAGRYRKQRQRAKAEIGKGDRQNFSFVNKRACGAPIRGMTLPRSMRRFTLREARLRDKEVRVTAGISR
jgi:hypothetical protein